MVRSVDPADSVSACEHLRRDGLHASCVIIIAHCILRSPEFKPIFLLFSSSFSSFFPCWNEDVKYRVPPGWD